MAAVSSNDTRHPTPRAVAKATGRFFKWCEDVFFCMTFVFTGLHDVSRPPRTARILPFGCVIDATGWRDSLSNLHDWAMAQCTESHSGFREKKTCKKQTCNVIQWKLTGAVRTDLDWSNYLQLYEEAPGIHLFVHIRGTEGILINKYGPKMSNSTAHVPAGF